MARVTYRSLGHGVADVATCAKTAASRFRKLFYGSDDVRREVLLWSYLRMRSYTRHAATTTFGRMLTLGDEYIAGMVAHGIGESLLEPLRACIAMEPQLFREGVFTADWLADAVHRQMVERDVVGRIIELVDLSEAVPLAEPFLDEATLDTVAAVIRLRVEYRATSVELQDILGPDDVDTLATRLADAAPQFRRADQALSDLVRRGSEPSVVAVNLAERFYEPPTKEVGARFPRFLSSIASGPVLRLVDLPWLTGSQVDVEPSSAWWV